MARISNVKELYSLIAHPSGHSCLVKWNNYIVTGGGDGMISVYNVADNCLEVVAARRVHKGAVTCINVSTDKSCIFSCGDEGVIYSIKLVGNTLESTIIHRSTLAIRAMCVLNEDFIVAFGDELKLVLIEHQSFTVKYSTLPLSTAISCLAAHTQQCFIAVSSNGIVKEYSAVNDTLEEVQSINLNISLEHSTIHKINEQTIAICCPQNGVLIMEHFPKLVLLDHTRPFGATNFSMEILTSNQYALILHSMNLELFDLESNQVAIETKVPLNNVYRMLSLGDNNYAFIDVEGNLSLYSITVELPPQEQSPQIEEKTPKKRKNILSLFDSDEEEKLQKMAKVHSAKDEKTVSKKVKKSTKKSKKNKFIDDDAKDDNIDDFDQMTEEEGDEEMEEAEEGDSGEDILNDFDVEPENENEGEGEEYLADAIDSTEKNTSNFKSIYSPFQPSSTPVIDGYQILCWNNIGVINSRHDSGYQSIEIEFHDKNFHRSIRFIDEVGYRMACLGRGGALFGAPKREGVKAQVNGVPLDGIDRSNPWTIEFDDEENVLGVTVGGSGKLKSPYVGIVATSHGFIRTFSMQGLQGTINIIPGTFVTMAANDAFLTVLYTGSTQQNDLHFVVYSLGNLSQVATGPLGGRFSTNKVTWLGLLEGTSPISAVYDEKGCFSILYPESNYTWQPWLIRPHLWPILFNRTEVLAVVLNETAEYPEVIPRPVPTPIPLQIPFIGEDKDSIDLIHRANQVFMKGEMSEKEHKKMQINADKQTLELFQQSIRSDRLSRAIELCKWLLNEKSWNVAVQLAKHNRILQLADCIESLKDEIDAINKAAEDPLSNYEETAPVITPRNMKKVLSRPNNVATTYNNISIEQPSLLTNNYNAMEDSPDLNNTNKSTLELPFSTLSMTPAKKEENHSIKKDNTLQSILKNISKSSNL